MSEPTCGECPDYEPINSQNGNSWQGLCYLTSNTVIGRTVQALDNVCKPRLRKIKALAEVKRLRGKLKAIAESTDPPRKLVCPPISKCPSGEMIFCEECWQQYIDGNDNQHKKRPEPPTPPPEPPVEYIKEGAIKRKD